MTDVKVYSEAETVERLRRELPHWSYADGALQRVYATGGWKATLLAVGAVAHLAEAAFHHPDLIVTYPRLTVRLSTHDAGGITDKDFELARKVEDVVGWQPGKEGGALTGPPDDPRFTYLKHD
jgi:4a-hydroxytetrahydrobiopterin dehydratase